MIGKATALNVHFKIFCLVYKNGKKLIQKKIKKETFIK